MKNEPKWVQICLVLANLFLRWRIKDLMFLSILCVKGVTVKALVSRAVKCYQDRGIYWLRDECWICVFIGESAVVSVFIVAVIVMHWLGTAILIAHNITSTGFPLRYSMLHSTLLGKLCCVWWSRWLSHILWQSSVNFVGMCWGGLTPLWNGDCDVLQVVLFRFVIICLFILFAFGLPLISLKPVNSWAFSKLLAPAWPGLFVVEGLQGLQEGVTEIIVK